MLILNQSIAPKPVMSLQTGSKIASAISPIINPDNLKIEGFYCDDGTSAKLLVLLTQDIRESIAKGYIVNDYQSLTDPDELIRLQNILKINFQLLGKAVYTDGGKKIGKVDDFAVESSSMMVQKIYVSQSILKSMSVGQLGIDRSQIVSITDRKIVVREPTVRADVAKPLRAPQPSPA
jgi:sporulation protein YlmC with PRC-barrel domain